MFPRCALSAIGRCDLGLDLHAGRDLERAGGLRLRDRTPSSPVGHLHQALPASTDRIKQRMIAKSRHFDSDELGGANHKRALGHRYLDVVDRESDQVLARLNS